MSKRIKILFTISVLLNVLVMGSAAGFAIKRYMDNPWHDVKEDLAPESRKLISTTMRSSFKDVFPLINGLKSAKRDIMLNLRAEDFDPELFEALGRKMVRIQNEMLEHRLGVTKDLAEKLPAEDRQKMAGKLAGAMMFGERPHHKNKKKYKEKGAARFNKSEVMKRWKQKRAVQHGYEMQKGSPKASKTLGDDKTEGIEHQKLESPKMPKGMPPLPDQ